ncbi:MAG: lysophospholipid acyltransferase family protein [Deltaproteobacteria bacterium]
MWYYFLRWLAMPFFWLYCRLTVTGRENLPKKTNFIIVANHVSFLDPLVIMVAVPKKIYCIALRDIYKFDWLRWFLRLTETLPSGSSSPQALAIIEKDQNLGLFPEGGVSRDGELKEFRRGAALLALKTGRPVVPCAVLGTFDALPFGSNLPKPVRLKVKIGKPIYLLKELDEQIDDVQLQQGTMRIRAEIKRLLDAG